MWGRGAVTPAFLCSTCVNYAYVEDRLQIPPSSVQFPFPLGRALGGGRGGGQGRGLRVFSCCYRRNERQERKYPAHFWALESV